MTELVTIAKALGDDCRTRALMALSDGELCVCQLIELLGLSPSTVSKHMSVLHQAGLVTRRKDGRWHYYRLAGRDASPTVRGALRWAQQSLADERVIVADTRAMCCIRKKAREEIAACYTAR